MQLVYESKVIDDPKVNLAKDLKETIFWLEGTDDGDDYVIKMDERLYKILDNELCLLDDLPRPHLDRFMGYDYILDNDIDYGCYCIYRKDKSIPIKLTPVKTLDEWFANLPLIHKIDLYNNFTKILAENLK